MKKCIVCGGGFDPKNPKGVYCSSVCRQKDYRKRVAEILEDARKGNRPGSPIRDIPLPLKIIEATTDHSEEESIKEQIRAIVAEKIPEHRNKSELGRKSWKMDQDKRIRELKNKLK